MAADATENVNTAKRVVIVGGGFAGLHCAMKLAASKAAVQITLIDRDNYQQFQPLLYQVATGLLSPENAAFNLRDVFRPYENVHVMLSEVESVDLQTRTVKGRRGDQYEADFLVLAAGSEANFFGVAGAEQLSLPMYSLRDAERLRSRLLEMLEQADVKTPSSSAEGLHVLVVGGGPTGVETAGALADTLQRTPKHLFTNLDLSKITITLVDAGAKLLKPFTEQSQDYAVRILEERGVTLRMETSVKEITEGDVLLSDGSRVAANLVIWAGGLKASALSGSLGVSPGRGGRLDVTPELTVEGFPGVYAVGDFCNAKDADGKALPQLAAVAQQAGRHCAENIEAAVGGKEQKPFKYVDKGIMAMVGRNAAVAEIGSKHHPITGVFAFAAWLGVHAVLLTTVRAKLESFFEWAWDYFGSVHVSPILDRPTVDWAPESSPREPQ